MHHNFLNKNQDKFVMFLFTSLIVILFPIIVASTLFPSLRGSGAYNFVVGLSFIIQTTLIVYYFINYTHKRFNIYSIFLMVILLIIQLVTVANTILSPLKLNYYDIINSFTMFVSFFLFVCITSSLKITRVSLLWFMKGIVVLGILASLFNIVTNFEGLLNIGSVSNPYSVNYMSFYLNRNSFAQFLFFAIVANTFLFMFSGKKRYYLIYILFAINLLATFSRGALATTLIFCFVYFIFNYNKSILRKIFLTVSLAIISIIILSQEKVRQSIESLFLRAETGTTGRSDLWSEGFNLLNQTNWFFGVGEFTAVNYIRELGYKNSEFHSFYVETLVKGGLALSLFYFVIFIIVLSKVKVIFSHDRSVGQIYFAALMALIFYGFFESISFFTMGYVGTLFTIFYITIPILYSNNFVFQEKKVNTY